MTWTVTGCLASGRRLWPPCSACAVAPAGAEGRGDHDGAEDEHDQHPSCSIIMSSIIIMITISIITQHHHEPAIITTTVGIAHHCLALLVGAEEAGHVVRPDHKGRARRLGLQLGDHLAAPKTMGWTMLGCCPTRVLSHRCLICSADLSALGRPSTRMHGLAVGLGASW